MGQRVAGFADPSCHSVSDGLDKYLAFTNRCTHAKRKIDPIAGERKLRCCSVNHSTFDYDGKPLSGPAKESLKLHQVETNQGNLLVTL